jgi:hypothetical protein
MAADFSRSDNLWQTVLGQAEIGSELIDPCANSRIEKRTPMGVNPIRYQ